jgi:hypothetical protein
MYTLMAVAAARLTADSSSGTAPTNDIITSLVPYLNLGLIVVMLIMAMKKVGFVPKWTLDDLTVEHEKVIKAKDEAQAFIVTELRARLVAADADRAELKEAVTALQNYQRDQLGPALIESSRVISRYVDALARRGGDV